MTDEDDHPRIIPQQIGCSIRAEFTVAVDDRLPQNGQFILNYCIQQGWAGPGSSITGAAIGRSKKGNLWRIFNE